MKVMKYFAVASLALFAACNNEENLVVPEGANQPVDVMMSVALPGPGTRAAMGDLQNTAKYFITFIIWIVLNWNY